MECVRVGFVARRIAPVRCHRLISHVEAAWIRVGASRSERFSHCSPCAVGPRARAFTVVDPARDSNHRGLSEPRCVRSSQRRRRVGALHLRHRVSVDSCGIVRTVCVSDRRQRRCALPHGDCCKHADCTGASELHPRVRRVRHHRSAAAQRVRR
eukprot:Amastigsp_a510160_20.p3 type:complete len:154 gc:universal Amastigsp_a510160_20:2424-1963(-)